MKLVTVNHYRKKMTDDTGESWDSHCLVRQRCLGQLYLFEGQNYRRYVGLCDVAKIQTPDKLLKDSFCRL